LARLVTQHETAIGTSNARLFAQSACISHATHPELTLKEAEICQTNRMRLGWLSADAAAEGNIDYARLKWLR